MTYIEARAIVDLRSSLPGRYVWWMDAGSRGDLILGTADHPREWQKWGEPPPKPEFPDRYYYWDGDTLEAIDLGIDLRLDRGGERPVQHLGDGRWLVRSARTASIFTAAGERIMSFPIGADAIHVQASAAGQIWIGHGEDAALSWDPRAGGGAVCFDTNGIPLLRYDDLAQRHGLPLVFHCYALNVVSERETWLFYYNGGRLSLPGYTLVRLVDLELAAAWPDVPVHGASAVAILGNHALFAGGYVSTDKTFRSITTELELSRRRLLLVDLTSGEAVELHAQYESSGAIRQEQVQARGATLYLRTEATIYAVEVHDAKGTQ